MLISVLSIVFATNAVCDATEWRKLNGETSIALNAQGLFEVGEYGADLEVFDAGVWRAIALPGSRLGSHFVPIKGKTGSVLVRPTSSRQSVVRLKLHCSDPSEWDWLMKAQIIAQNIDYTRNSTEMTSEVAALEALGQRAFTPWTKAAYQNMWANTLYSSGKLDEAQRFYELAAESWTQAQEPVRAQVMLLASAELAYRQMHIPFATKKLNSIGDDFIGFNLPYFNARKLDLACKLKLLANPSVNDFSCWIEVIDSYAALGEIADELNSSINLVHAVRNIDRAVNINGLSALLARIPEKPEFSLYRGRFFFLEGLLHRDQGDLGSAVSSFSSAIQAFAVAKEESHSSAVDVFTRIASMYADLGLTEQSFGVLGAGLKSIRAKDVPLQTVILLNQTADVLLEQGYAHASLNLIQNALLLKDRVRIIDYENLKLTQATIERQLGVINEARMLEVAALTLPMAKIFYLNWLIEQGQMTSAREHRKLIDEQFASSAPKVAVLNAFEASKSALDILGGDRAKASQRLLVSLERIGRLSDASTTASMAYLTSRAGEKIRRTWVDFQISGSPFDEIFTSILISNPARFMTSVKTPLKQLQIVTKKSEGELGFLQQLTAEIKRTPERFKAFPTPSLANFQARMPAGGLALLLVPGEKQSLALWIDASRARLQLLPGRKVFQNKVAELSALTASPASSRAATESAARSLSEVLFAGFVSKSDALPSSLWVLADELPGAIPFSALYWPGQAEPLVASTEVSLITGLRINDLGDLAGKAELVKPAPVFFAPLYDPKKGALQALDFAEVERRRIEMQSERTLLAYTGVAANRHAFQDLVQTPGIWMHVAAHGRADPGVLGNAGLWLSGERGEPDFLSWLELGNLRVQAELLVLNACQSATGAQPSRQANVSFALAMSASGARNVVAALWPVSDAAAGTWIPAFYRNLADSKSAEQSGAALRQAQLALYRSPHYRQPFYWASLVHFRRLDF